MNIMTARIAKAIAVNLFTKESYIGSSTPIGEISRTVLVAILVPTPAMIRAGEMAFETGGPEDIWRAMIGAALAEDEDAK